MSNELIVSQYQKLKEEQLERIKARDNLILVQLGAVGTIISFILSKDNADRPLIEFGYLLIPWISSVLAWLYYSQDEKIREIKAFLKAEGVYGECSWEKHRSSGKRIGLLIALDIIILLLPSALALWQYPSLLHANRLPSGVWLNVIWWICVGIVVFTVYSMVASYASKPERPVEPVEAAVAPPPTEPEKLEKPSEGV